MARKKKAIEVKNPLVESLEWLLEASSGSPRAIGIRYDRDSNEFTIKQFESLRVVKEVVVEGIREASKLTADLETTLAER